MLSGGNCPKMAKVNRAKHCQTQTHRTTRMQFQQESSGKNNNNNNKVYSRHVRTIQ